MKRHCLILFLFVATIPLLYAQADVLDQSVRLDRQKSTVFDLLNRVGELCGYNFIYDSKVTDSERKVKITSGNYSVRDAVFAILGSRDYALTVVDRYILIDRSGEHPSVVSAQVSAYAKTDTLNGNLYIRGTIVDRFNNNPVGECSVGIDGTSIGTIANSDGRFALRIPLSLKDASLHVSHIGFEARQIPLGVLSVSNCTIYLTQRIIPLQEVIVRMVNPGRIVQEAVDKRVQNYADEPAYLTSFYREGVEKRKELLYLSEAIFKIFKPSSTSSSDDQMKLLKMRRITNRALRDTLLLKMQAGPDASLKMDLMKYIPDFLDNAPVNSFNYTKIDMVECDSHLAHVVAFEPKPDVEEPTYRGKLYIDAENSALLRAEFELDPRFLDQAASLYIVRHTKGIQIHSQQIVYHVSYKYWNGRYYINNLRGDLYFKMKARHQLFYSPLHLFFESATCKIETMDVKPFPQTERLQTRQILGDVDFIYDNAFWGDFNIILPQEALNEAIGKIIPKVEASE